MSVYVNQEVIEEIEEEEVEPIADDLLLLEMVRAIVPHPEKVRVNEHCDVSTGEAWKILTIRVDSRDLGIVIGRYGRTIDLFKTYISLIGARRGYPISITIAGTNGHKTTRGKTPIIEHIERNKNVQ
jgi:predicted RNA-binding protein YlqC (UPF0109 family)